MIGSEHDDPSTDLPRALLDTWDVPPPSPGLADRVSRAWLRETAVHVPPKRSRWWIPAVAATVIAVVGIATLLANSPRFRQGDSAAVLTAPPLPPVDGVSLVLVVEPSDATVWLDGRRVTGPTPHVVGETEPGGHAIRIERDGFLPYERELDLGPKGLELSVRLERRQVTLRVESEPANATVTIVQGGVRTELGRAGAHAIDRLPGVTYEAVVAAEGYESRTVPLVFGGGPEETLRVVLDGGVPEPTGGASHRSPDLKDPFSTRKRGGPSVDESPRGAMKDPFGSRSVEKKKPRKTKTGMKDPFAESPDLSDPFAALVRVSFGVAAGDAPAKVFVDGKPLGTTPVTTARLRVGRHRVEYRWPDGTTRKTAVQLTEDGPRVVRLPRN